MVVPVHRFVLCVGLSDDSIGALGVASFAGMLKDNNTIQTFSLGGVCSIVVSCCIVVLMHSGLRWLVCVRQ